MVNSNQVRRKVNENGRRAKGEMEKGGNGERVKRRAVLEGSYAGRDALRAWKEAVLEEREILRRVAPQNDRRKKENGISGDV